MSKEGELEQPLLKTNATFKSRDPFNAFTETFKKNNNNHSDINASFCLIYLYLFIDYISSFLLYLQFYVTSYKRIT